MLVLSLTLAACSNTNNNSNQEHHSNTRAPKNAKTLKEKDVFSPSKKGQKISGKEMKQALEKYLRANSNILDNKYVMQHKLDKQGDSNPRITESQAGRLSKLSNLTVKNDSHFKKFIKNNHIPEEYKDPTDCIINYLHTLNSTISNVDEDIEKLNYQPQNSINIVDVATKYSDGVNKRRQDKITTLLKKKGISTEVFNK